MVRKRKEGRKVGKRERERRGRREGRKEINRVIGAAPAFNELERSQWEREKKI